MNVEETSHEHLPTTAVIQQELSDISFFYNTNILATSPSDYPQQAQTPYVSRDYHH